MSAEPVVPGPDLLRALGPYGELAKALAEALHCARTNPEGHELTEALVAALNALGVLRHAVERARPALPAPEPPQGEVPSPPDLQGNVVNLTRLIRDAEGRWGPCAEHGLTRAEFVAIELHRQGVRGARGAAPERAQWDSICDGCGQYALCHILTPTLDGTPTYSLCATCIHNAARHEQLAGRVSEAQESKP